MDEGAPVTILFTDVEGSTDLRTRRGDASAHEILRAHEVVRSCVNDHGGREVKSLGDGFMTAFASARRALACAVAIQQAVEHKKVESSAGGVRLRIGVNTGEVVEEGDDLYGQGVNAAARIAARAQPGEILVAEVTRQLAGSGPDFTFSDRGRLRLKGFPERWRLYTLGWESKDAAIEVQLLGRFSVRKAGEEIPPARFGGSRVRVLVRFLVTRRGSFVPGDVLAEALWSKRVPADPTASLRTLIRRARVALEDPSLIVTGPGGYSFAGGDACVVDTEVFVAAVQAGHDHLAAGRVAAALGEFRSALDLWVGEPLAEDAYDDWAQEPRAVLSRAYLAALEGAAEAALAAGEPDQAVVLAERAVARQPLRESAALLLARAQVASGDVLDALRTIDAVRRRLGEEAGLELSREAVALETALQRGELVPGTAGPPAIPMPALLTDVGRIFVGRDSELERLCQLWKEATAGERRVALLAGEPGVGKTRLAAELAGQVHEKGAVVLVGRCDEDLGVPYQPFVEALRHFVDHTPPPDLKKRLGRFRGELVRLVAELADHAADLSAPLQSDPETERYRLFDAVAAWLAATAAEAPLLLVLDDLQWAAKPTLLLLRHLAHSAEHDRLFILGTYRDTDLAHDHPLVELVADLRRQGRYERISLTGLDHLAVTAMVSQAAGRPLSDDELDLARAIYEETEGNPFFVREVLRHLAERGPIERQGGRWAARDAVAELGIPEGVRDVIGRRLSRLSEATNQALRVAAVVGAEFDLAVIRSATAMAEEQVLSAVDEAVGARLVAEVSASRYRFAHALVRGTLYESLTAARQVALHRRVAEAIETIHEAHLDDQLPALAHHWARASAPVSDTTRAVDYARRAGDRALAQLAHDEAASYYRQALDLLDAANVSGDLQRVPLLIALGEAQRRAGDPAYRTTLLTAADLARDRGDEDALARAALANSRAFLYSAATEVDTERVRVLETALLRVDPSNVALRARLLANLGLELAWTEDRDKRVDLSNEALAAARRADDPATLIHVLTARDYTIAGPDNLDERLAHTAELLDLAASVGDPVLSSRALVIRFRAAMEAADVEEAEADLVENEELAAGLGQPVLSWAVRMQRAGLLIMRGELDAADRAVQEAYETGAAGGQPDANIFRWAQHALIRVEQDRIQEELQLSDFISQRNTSARAFFACHLLVAGRVDDARRIFDDIAAGGFAAPFDFIWLRYAADCAVLCAEFGDERAASRLYGMLEPYAERLVTKGWGSIVSGPVVHYLGLLLTVMGRYDDAQRSFERAASMDQRIGAPVWLARTQADWARMLLRRGRPGDTTWARDLLIRVRTAAQQLGLAYLERRTGGLLQECC